MSWKEPLEADARLAAQNAVKIRAALKQSVNSKTMFEAYQATQPQSTGNLAQTRARARAWAIINVRVNMETLKLILLQVWATGFLLGDLAAAEQIAEATRANRRKSAEINKAEAQVAIEIDWATWKPGDQVSALLLKPPKAFQRLLEQQGVTIKEITNTTLRDIGNAIGEAVELGLSAKQAANLINRSLANPARSLMIAITESNRAMSAATAARYQQAGLEQMEWTTFDPCDICARNDGTTVQIGAPFPSGHTRPPAHPHCRCALLPVIPGFDGSPQMPEGIETNPISPQVQVQTDVPPKPRTVGDYARATDKGRRDYEEMLENQEITDDLQYAAQRWQGEDYRRIQGALSGGKPSGEIAEIVNTLDDAMMPLDDMPGFLYRGQTDGLQDLVVGDKFRSPLYQAATTDPITAAGFSKSSGSVTGGIREGEKATILRIDVFDAKGVVVPDSSEMEIILARNTTFEVYKIEDVTINGVDLRVIDVEAVSK